MTKRLTLAALLCLLAFPALAQTPNPTTYAVLFPLLRQTKPTGSCPASTNGYLDIVIAGADIGTSWYCPAAGGTWTQLPGGGGGTGDALTTNPLSQFAATSSAQLRGVLSDESGNGAALFAGGALGAATATTINKVTITQPASGSTLTIADGKTLTASDNATVSGTNTGDQTSVTGNAGTATALATALPSTRVPFGNGTGTPATDSGFTFDSGGKVLTTTGGFSSANGFQVYPGQITMDNGTGFGLGYSLLASNRTLAIVGTTGLTLATTGSTPPQAMKQFQVTDASVGNSDPGNRIDLYPNDNSSMTATMDCSTCTAGHLCIQDSVKTSTHTYDFCVGSTLILRLPATSVTTNQPLIATSTAGAPAFRDLAPADIIASQTANEVLASPSGSTGLITKRALTSADMPLSNPATTLSGAPLHMTATNAYADNNFTVSGGFAGGREIVCGGKAGSFTTDSPLTLAGGSVSVIANPGIGYRMMRPGSIIGISIQLTGTAGTNNVVDFETYINGTLSMVHSRTITGTSSNQGGITTQARNTSGSTFVAGDVIQLNANLNATSPPTLSSLVMCVEFVFDS